jgi:FkbM family methyltransferase
VLKRNIELNHLRNIRAFNFAVAGYAGFTTISTFDGISTHYTMTKQSDMSAPASRVPCYRLLDILKLLDIDHVDLVKMDIEGLELEVLQSSFPALGNRILKLDIEVHRFQDLAPVSKILRSNGFAVRAKRAGILSRSYRVLAAKIPPGSLGPNEQFKNKFPISAVGQPRGSSTETKVANPA